ncbi:MULTISPECIES: FeoA family protein [Methanobacterium]|jgi:DtxR family Mn-dependent transcriptional regulator|uniref:FeoA family protein n=1 Tax=Methanobacterium veterum TaxID=408577 RepID=A0A9E5DPX1_9EURY|nr:MULTISPECIES: FeoA family protein [Methanobacterium]MCZ3366708.1 FeoA family protein [Methanobacterium veterum]MCZ3374147.1 FeoA family protein [Methanobacterium veterum]
MKKNMEIKIPNFELIKENTSEGHTCTCSSGTGSRSACGCCGGSCKCAKKSFLPLAQMKKGQYCKIAYIKPGKYEKSHKILSLLPGSKVKIIQTSPSHIFQVENIQIAVDSTLGNNIYVDHLK